MDFLYSVHKSLADVRLGSTEIVVRKIIVTSEIFGLRQVIQNQLFCPCQYLLNGSVFRRVFVGGEHGMWLWPGT